MDNQQSGWNRLRSCSLSSKHTQQCGRTHSNRQTHKQSFKLLVYGFRLESTRTFSSILNIEKVQQSVNSQHQRPTQITEDASSRGAKIIFEFQMNIFHVLLNWIFFSKHVFCSFFNALSNYANSRTLRIRISWQILENGFIFSKKF